MTTPLSPKLLIIGGQGALGSMLIEHFKIQGYIIFTISRGVNSDTLADCAIPLGNTMDLKQQLHLVTQTLDKSPTLKFEGILCVAGGWVGGTLKDPNFLENADLMWRQCVHSSLLAVSLSATYLKEGGLLVLTGTKVALTPTPGMIAYGMAKAGVHNLIKSLGDKDSGLPEGCKIIGILPLTLDTPNNRKWMPNADTGTWTPLIFIASLIQTWLQDVASAPISGSLISLNTQNGQTVTEIN